MEIPNWTTLKCTETGVLVVDYLSGRNFLSLFFFFLSIAVLCVYCIFTYVLAKELNESFQGNIFLFLSVVLAFISLFFIFYKYPDQQNILCVRKGENKLYVRNVISFSISDVRLIEVQKTRFTSDEFGQLRVVLHIDNENFEVFVVSDVTYNVDQLGFFCSDMGIRFKSHWIDPDVEVV